MADKYIPLLDKDHHQNPPPPFPEEQDSSSYKPPPIHTEPCNSGSSSISSPTPHRTSLYPPPASIPPSEQAIRKSLSDGNLTTLMAGEPTGTYRPPPVDLTPRAGGISRPPLSSPTSSYPPAPSTPYFPSIPSSEQNIRKSPSDGNLPLVQRIHVAGPLATMEEFKKFQQDFKRKELLIKEAEKIKRALEEQEIKKIAAKEAIRVAEAEAAAAREATIKERERFYDQKIVPPEPGRIIKICQDANMDPVRVLVKEKEELNNHVSGIFSSGRGLKYEICMMIVAGTLTLGFLSAIMKALLAEKVSTLEKWTVLGIFSFAFLLSISSSVYDLYHVYRQPLIDAHASRASLIRRMNFFRDSLTVLESEQRGEVGKEELQLNRMMTKYCDTITAPLPIGWQRISCFIQVGSMILIIIVAFIFMALTPPPPSEHDGCKCGA